jgi:4-hydroxybenzoate polyprenyltransferase
MSEGRNSSGSIAFLKLTRPVNLFIIGLTMFLMRYGVIEGNLERGLNQLAAHQDVAVPRSELHVPEGFSAQMPMHHFLLLILGTVLIAGAGNVINDYFDTRIDRINKPGQVIVGRKIKRRVAMGGHLIMSAAGLVISAFVAWRSGMLHLVSIPLFAIAALWSYSTLLKRRLIAGNVLVALLTALVPLAVGLYEIPLLREAFTTTEHIVRTPGGTAYATEPAFHELWYWIFAYAVFAFFSTLVRELQKDMADVKGDLAGGCQTVPIAWGMKWARALTLFHISILVAGVLAVRMLLPGDRITYWYLGICVIGPLLLSAGFTYNAQERSEHMRAALLMKLAMVMAVAFSLLIPHLP